MTAYEPFAPLYDRWFPLTEDVPFYVELARASEGPVVELGVGTGRVAVPVARETGRKVLGIDLEPAMLARARERVADAGVDVELRLGDMRELELDEPAGLDYCSEWHGLVETTGFEVEALYGGFDLRPFDDTATEFVWVVRKH